MPKQVNAYVKLKPGENIDSALKRFNSQVENSKILHQIREREYYMKPSEYKRYKRLISTRLNKESQ